MEKILLAQFLAHLLADFFFQTENLCIRKQKSGPKSLHIYIHILIVFAFSAGLTFSCSFIFYSLFIAIAHFIIDILKHYAERLIKSRNNNNNQKLFFNNITFFIDQILHLTTIYLITHLYWTQNPCTPEYINYFSIEHIVTVIGFLLCFKPANVAIRVCLSSFSQYNKYIMPILSDNKTDLEKAGRWIGSMERLLTYIMILVGQYTAIGFIIAAKSILRYNNDKDSCKTEYVLIGTLLSFSIAILIGVCVTLLQ